MDHQSVLPDIHELIRQDREILTELEHQVADAIEREQLVAENLSEPQEARTRGEAIADKVASFGGSWTFIGSFGLVLVLWIITNAVLLRTHPFDPFPFILLNLILSCLAAIQAPVIMMSQNRQESRDRERAKNDYKVNLKAEVEVRMLHEKIDHLLISQMQRLMEIQEYQVKLLEELQPKS